ncbi:MAG: glycosyltransferase [Alistipes sp.]|nr:glycosyltransferase [Alistipes sp.]
MPKVSVIVPVHNTERYLQACVDSLTAQTLTDIEIVLVENCSTDDSLALCHSLAAAESRIKVLSIDKADLSTARNEGVKVATGEYIAFVDSDDTVLPTLCEENYNLAVQHDLGLVCFSLHKVYDNRADKYPYSNDGSIKIVSAKEMTTLNLSDISPAYVCSHLFKRTLFEQLSFPENIFYEDRASTFLFTAACGKGAVVNKSYYRYYCRDGSISRSFSWKHYRDFAFANLCRLEFINNSGLFTAEEMPSVASASADSFLRKLRHMLSRAKTAEQRDEALEWCRKLNLIPKGARLPLKARLIRWYIERFIL